jgi:hypothetical protein
MGLQEASKLFCNNRKHIWTLRGEKLSAEAHPTGDMFHEAEQNVLLNYRVCKVTYLCFISMRTS